MEAMNIAGKKVPPGTAPKPGSGHYTDDIPPPPSDLGAHLYKQPPKVPGNIILLVSFYTNKLGRHEMDLLYLHFGIVFSHCSYSSVLS